MPLPSKRRAQEQKSLSELLEDPHFIFTILSLVVSLGVFFYYLFQLLFRTEGFSSRKSSSSKLKDDEAAAKKLTEEGNPPIKGASVEYSKRDLSAIVAELRKRGERRKEYLDELDKRVASEGSRSNVQQEQEQEEQASVAAKEADDVHEAPVVTKKHIQEEEREGVMEVTKPQQPELRRRKTAGSRREE
eukprot:CAMPEP_0176417040 /NCGR_PEP_ID=MMETSP0127-20121128/6668_1 /TAXON_ID=938130 /ORGANISM="Platyophrya macrostoma, Strain WH" /LENGTH=188 /DNA_ID=CAMNT_0017797157 /DNA_START=162 /DNA_END=728 /DNA_ORIENTATION=-